MESVASPGLPAPSPVEAAREALGRHAWQDAYDLYRRADEQGLLDAEGLEALAEAAWFTGHADQGIEAKERAFKARQAEGDPVRAAAIALDLAREHAYKRRLSLASAWMRRAERLLEGREESIAHGYLALARSEVALEARDLEAAAAKAGEAVAIATRLGDADLLAFAQSALGRIRITAGETRDGIALLEEAAVAAVNGELTPFCTGVTCCSMIAACRDLADYRRASEWTEATERYCERQSVAGFPGVCRIHRAEVAAVGGAWDQAEAQLRQATDELAAYNATPPLADAWYALGEIRLRKGELGAAEDALRRAHALGRTPQPALSLIRLAEGKTRAASLMLSTALDEEGADQWGGRARLLPARVEISIAAGDVASARAAAEELDGSVAAYETPARVAARHEAWGRVLLAERDAAGAARELRAAIRAWREVGAPYDVARDRALLASALRDLGDDDEADLELRAALDEFRRLGARLDAAAAERALEAGTGAGRQARRTFMFTDIVGSTSLAEALGDEPWEQLLRWHDDTLRARFAAAGGEVVKSIGDGFFVAFESARRAVDCAIEIQRALAEQRRTSGFALPVRIGLHAADANRRGDDYSGIGVHVAARVGALAGGGEILATAETLAEAGRESAEGFREVALRGVSAPVRVGEVSWA